MNKLIELEQENAKLKEIIIDLLLKQKSSQEKQKNNSHKKSKNNKCRRKKVETKNSVPISPRLTSPTPKCSLTLYEKMDMSLDEIIEKTHGKQYLEQTKNIDEFAFE